MRESRNIAASLHPKTKDGLSPSVYGPHFKTLMPDLNNHLWTLFVFFTLSRSKDKWVP
jgi:hypothetical protein